MCILYDPKSQILMIILVKYRYLSIKYHQHDYYFNLYNILTSRSYFNKPKTDFAFNDSLTNSLKNRYNTAESMCSNILDVW